MVWGGLGIGAAAPRACLAFVINVEAVPGRELRSRAGERGSYGADATTGTMVARNCVEKSGS